MRFQSLSALPVAAQIGPAFETIVDLLWTALHGTADNAMAYNLLGLLLKREGLQRPAMAAYATALRCQPEFAEVLSWLRKGLPHSLAHDRRCNHDCLAGAGEPEQSGGA